MKKNLLSVLAIFLMIICINSFAYSKSRTPPARKNSDNSELIENNTPSEENFVCRYTRFLCSCPREILFEKMAYPSKIHIGEEYRFLVKASMKLPHFYNKENIKVQMVMIPPIKNGQVEIIKEKYLEFVQYNKGRDYFRQTFIVPFEEGLPLGKWTYKFRILCDDEQTNLYTNTFKLIK